MRSSFGVTVIFAVPGGPEAGSAREVSLAGGSTACHFVGSVGLGHGRLLVIALWRFVGDRKRFDDFSDELRLRRATGAAPREGRVEGAAW